MARILASVVARTRLIGTVLVGFFLIGAVLCAGGPAALAAGPGTAAQTFQVAQATAMLPAPSPRPAVIGARIGVHPGMTRFVLELSESVPFRATAEADPYRVVVELPDLAWSAAAAGAGRGVVRRYRYVADESGGHRLVFDTDGPARVRDAFFIPAQEGHHPRLVIDMERVSVPEFEGNRKSVEARAETKAAAATAVPVPTVQPARVLVPPAPSPAPTASPLASPPTRRAAPPREKPLVVIDPGHGGDDPGAIGVGGIHEKDITLATARELRRQLEATGHYRVRLTRDKDVFIRLRERVAIARDADADLFISLHADSISSGSIRGLSIYTLSDKASDREAEMLAAKENRADAIAGLDLSGENDLVASILIDLAQRDTMNQSKRFAGLTLENVRHEVRLLEHKPHRQAGFAVLTAPDVPSVLIEMGYLSSPQDAGLLTSQSHRERLTRSIARAVDGYFRWLNGRRS